MKTTADFLRMKQEQEKIVMLTAYDYPSAKFAEEGKVDVILVGDSLGMVVLGYESTANVTVDDMIHHTKAVKRGAQNTFIVVDMPFGSYQGSEDRILQHALRLFQETGAEAVKVEGAGEVVHAIQLLTRTGIPVVGHLGLLPQLANVEGGYKVQAKTASAAEKLLEDARKVEAAGACMLVLECIPHQLAEKVAKELTIPVIGIGAGGATDGQVLVFHDILQYGSHHIPKFVEKFGNIGEVAQLGIDQYVQAVKSHQFPMEQHQFTMKEEELTALYGQSNGK